MNDVELDHDDADVGDDDGTLLLRSEHVHRLFHIFTESTVNKV